MTVGVKRLTQSDRRQCVFLGLKKPAHVRESAKEEKRRRQSLGGAGLCSSPYVDSQVVRGNRTGLQICQTQRSISTFELSSAMGYCASPRATGNMARVVVAVVKRTLGVEYLTGSRL